MTVPAPTVGGLRAADVLGLPPDSPRVELLDGVMLVVPSPTMNHQSIASLIWLWLRRNAPASYRAVQAVGIEIDEDTTLEPDVVLLREPVANSHFFLPAQVALVVEVVSPGTRHRDRVVKPALYAASGITHYWRVEQEPRLQVVAYDLIDDGSGARYRLACDSYDFDDVLTLKSRPFPVSLAIADITP